MAQNPAHGSIWVYFDTKIEPQKFGGAPEEVKYYVVFWRFSAQQWQVNQPYKYTLQSTVNLKQTAGLKCWAEVVHEESLLGQSELLSLEVQGQAQSLKYLPSMYQTGDYGLMWRYMMIFDSFWRLFENRLSNMPAYFDPNLTPPDFKPWLASWVGMTWDERLPERHRESLIFSMVDLYKKRGTRQGLQQYLQLSLGLSDKEAENQIEISENPPGNFILGENIEMGADIIMGSPEDEICKFTVMLKLSPSHQNVEENLLRDLIETWKPAHTAYSLYLYS